VVFRGRTVLDGVDLEVWPGEIVGVVGPGGSGKSILLKCLPRLVTPTTGRVLLDGVDLAGLSGPALAQAREDYGYLFQNYALFDFMTVLDNVAFPLRQEGHLSDAAIVSRATERLDQVGLRRALAQYPRELSGGMKKRVALARATVSDPPMALYDDPTAGLDPVTSSRIFALIAAMHERVSGGTSVIVSHDIDRMRAVCTRFVALFEGRVVFNGPLASLSQAPSEVQALFEGAEGPLKASSGGGRSEAIPRPPPSPAERGPAPRVRPTRSLTVRGQSAGAAPEDRVAPMEQVPPAPALPPRDPEAQRPRAPADPDPSLAAWEAIADAWPNGLSEEPPAAPRGDAPQEDPP
jgi:phospholipid/cholesterol/gamma-HCH transport system ATP-binding protein